MGGHLAAIDDIVFPHALLHESMAALAQDGHAAVLSDNGFRVPDKARIVHDPAARIALQERFRQEADQIVAFNEFSLFVAEETTVEIPIPGNAQVGVGGQDGVAGLFPRGFQHRIRHAMRKSTVRLIIDLFQRERQSFFQLRQDRAGPAVAGVHDDLQRFQPGYIDVFQEMLHIGRHDVLFRQEAPGLAGHQMMGEFVDADHFADFLQARVGTDRPRATADKLHAVVFGRIMAGRDHDAPVGLQIGRGEINHFRAALADIDDVGAAIPQAVAQGLDQGRPRQPDIVADDDVFRPEQGAKHLAHSIRQFLIHFVGNFPADVIRFECRRIQHAFEPLFSCRFCRSACRFVQDISCAKRFETFFARYSTGDILPGGGKVLPAGENLRISHLVVPSCQKSFCRRTEKPADTGKKGRVAPVRARIEHFPRQQGQGVFQGHAFPQEAVHLLLQDFENRPAQAF